LPSISEPGGTGVGAGIVDTGTAGVAGITAALLGMGAKPAGPICGAGSGSGAGTASGGRLTGEVIGPVVEQQTSFGLQNQFSGFQRQGCRHGSGGASTILQTCTFSWPQTTLRFMSTLILRT